MTDDVVVTIHGASLTLAQDAVVSELEYLLDKAKDRQLDGFAYAASYTSGGTSSNRKGLTSNGLLGSLERIKAHLITEMASD